MIQCAHLSSSPMAISLQFCRLPTRSDLSFPGNLAGIFSERSRKPLSVRCDVDSSSSVAVESEFDAKVFRKNLTRSKNYNRKGFGHKKEIADLMNREYTSKIFLISLIKSSTSFSWNSFFFLVWICYFPVCRWYYKDFKGERKWVHMGKCYGEIGGVLRLLLGSGTSCPDCLWS